MKKIITSIIFLFLLLAFSEKSFSVTDYYFDLKDVKVGSIVGEEIISVGSLDSTKDIDGVTVAIYSFTSSKYSNPHIVYLNVQTHEVLFIQLTVAASDNSFYRDLQNSFGASEVTLHKTRSETLESYPTKGTAFVVDEFSHTVSRVMKFQPTNVEEFKAKEGKNFKPDPNSRETQVVALFKTSPEPISSSSLSTTNRNLIFLSITIALCLIFIVLLFIFVIFKRRRGKSNL